MNELIWQILVPFIQPLIVAIVTALLTVRLSVRQFHSQRWWEKKAETYSTILERLSELQFGIGEDLAYWEGDRGIGSVDSDRAKRLQVMHQEARVAIAKAAAIGEFIVSSKTARVLERLHKDLETEEGGDPYDDAVRHYDSLKDAIPEIRKEAKKDLRVQ